MKACRIVIEGPDGVGKTSVATEVQHLLQARGFGAVKIREQDATPLSEHISESVRFTKGQSAAHELLMFMTMRSLAKPIVEDAVRNGEFVIADRGDQSTRVYQVVDAVTEEMFNSIIESVTPDVPTFHILLICSRETVLERKKAMGEDLDELEKRILQPEAYDALVEKYRALQWDYRYSTEFASPSRIAHYIVSHIQEAQNKQ